MRQQGLFGTRAQMTDSIQQTIDTLCAYLPDYRHVAVGWSGGKDSTALVTLLLYLIESGKVPRPERLTVCYADTRLELLPLWLSAREILEDLEDRGVEVEVVVAPMDKRFLVYILGRGVPPPNNNTLRWCTRQIKVDPMSAALRQLQGADTEKVLMLTGVRLGESSARDGRIALSCSTNQGECGQGWYQRSLPDALADTLAPILHWRVCHIWEWLKHWAPMAQYGDWSTRLLAEAYGGDEAEEIHARTGCVGCPLANRDTALDNLLKRPQWAYLRPLKGLRPLWRELRESRHRLRKPGGETRGDGTLVANQQRMGPLTFPAREMALERVLAIQGAVNAAAAAQRRPPIDLLNAEEETRIRQQIAEKTWPRGWDGTEPLANAPFSRICEGGVEELLPGFGRPA